MYLIQRIKCLFGKHERSRSAAVDYPDAMRSVCRGCGRRMIRDFNGWRIDDGPIPDAPLAPLPDVPPRPND